MAESELAEEIVFDDPTSNFYSNQVLHKSKTVKYSEKEKVLKQQPTVTEEIVEKVFETNTGENVQKEDDESPNISKIEERVKKKIKTEKVEDFKDSVSVSNTNTTNIENYLCSIGMIKLHCIGDGNCFFRTIAEFTEENHTQIRSNIVQQMNRNSQLYSALFHNTIRENYFIEELSVYTRCVRMEKDKIWAGFPERFAAAFLLNKNLFELYETGNSFHWNVFIGDSTPEIYDRNNLQNIYIAYNVNAKHFEPLRRFKNTEKQIKIANIFYLIRHNSIDSEAIFTKVCPAELTESHKLYQENTSKKLKPVGLRNLGNTCYFNSLMQCLAVLPRLHLAFQADALKIDEEDSTIKILVSLIKHIVEKSSPARLENKSRDLILKLQKRYEKDGKIQKYAFGKEEDPQELFTDLLDMINSELRILEYGYQTYQTIEETRHFHESFDKSNSTTLLTSYVKNERIMHSQCENIYFQAMPFLDIPFPEEEFQQIGLETLVDIYFKENETVIDACASCGLPNANLIEKKTMQICPNILIVNLNR